MGDCVRDDGLEGSFVGGVDYLKMRGLVNQNGGNLVVENMLLCGN